MRRKGEAAKNRGGKEERSSRIREEEIGMKKIKNENKEVERRINERKEKYEKRKGK